MKTLLTLSMLLFIGGAFAQKLSDDFEVSAAEPYQVVDAGDKRYIPLGNGQVIMAKTRGAIVTVQLFDGNEMKELKRNVYEDFPKYNKVQDLIHVGDKIFYIYESYDKKSKQFTCHSREIDVTDASFIDNKELFTTSRAVVGFPSEGQIGAMLLKFGKKFRVLQSFDGSKIMFSYRLKPLERSDAINKDVLGFQVFDGAMNKLSGEEVKMPHTEKEMNNLAYTVDKNGNGYMMAFLREAKKFELIKVTPDGSIESTPLDIDGDLVFEKFQLIEDIDGNILCAGYYANGYDFKMNWNGKAALAFNTNGIYMFKMDQTGKVLSTTDIPFSLELIKQYLSERQAEKMKKREADGKAGIEDLRIEKIFTQDDGSVIILGEQRYMRNEMYGTSTQEVYHYSNVVMTKVDKDGKEVWTKKLPKNQAGIASGFQMTPFFEGQMSIKHVRGDDSHYILFIDNPKNAGLAKNEVPKTHKNGMGGFISAFEVSDADGEFTRHTIGDLADLDGVRAYQFKVTRILEVMEKVFFMEIYIKGKKDTMVKMELK